MTRDGSSARDVPSGPLPGDRLESWKEIAAYLKRDVKTVRRWEKGEGLPVHRHRHSALASIYAFRSEIDAWRTGRDNQARAADDEAHSAPLVSLIERHHQLAHLHHALEQARHGIRQIVFVTGELGVGKTALVGAFAAERQGVCSAIGECMPQYGAVESYLPVVDALERLCRTDGARAARIVARHAPSWAGRLIPGAGRRSPASSSGADRDLLARELVDAIEALARDRPFVLALENLHWTDDSTVDLIARLARHSDAAPLFILGTYRQDAIAEDAPHFQALVNELQAHFQSTSFVVPRLSPAGVKAYLASRGAWRTLERTGDAFHQWTEGNPLFLVHMVQYLNDIGLLHQDDGVWQCDVDNRSATEIRLVPQTLRNLFEGEIDRLQFCEQQLLEAGSVVGVTFSSSSVACAVGMALPDVEGALHRLARSRRLIEPRVGAESAGYAFVHQFCCDVFYDRVAPGRRAALHQSIGAQLEAASNAGSDVVPSELAMHFERAGDPARAATYYAVAARNALRRSADAEARLSARRGLDLLPRLTAGADRDRTELELQLISSTALSNLHGMGDPRVKEAYGQVVATAKRLGDPPESLAALLGIARFHALCGELDVTLQINERTVKAARACGSGLAGALSNSANGQLLAGEFAVARTSALESLERIASHPDADDDAVASFGYDIRSANFNTLAWSSWCLGCYDEALAAVDAHLKGAEHTGHIASIAVAESWSAPVIELLGDAQRAAELARSARARLQQIDAPQARWWTDSMAGWLLARRGQPEIGAERVRASSEAQRRAGVLGILPWQLAWLAEALLLSGNLSAARQAANDGLDLCRRTGAGACVAELHRLHGEALGVAAGDDTSLEPHNVFAAERSFYSAIEVARMQHARTSELRARTSLARMWGALGKSDEAANSLAPMSEWLSASVATPDVRAARALIVDLQMKA